VLHTVYKLPLSRSQASLSVSQLAYGHVQHASGTPTASFTMYAMQINYSIRICGIGVKERQADTFLSGKRYISRCYKYE